MYHVGIMYYDTFFEYQSGPTPTILNLMKISIYELTEHNIHYYLNNLISYWWFELLFLAKFNGLRDETII